MKIKLKNILVLFGVIGMFVWPLVGFTDDKIPEGTIWVANGLDDSIGVINPVSGDEIAVIKTGVNPHILSVSPDEKIVYVINAGKHDRGPNAHSDTNVTENKRQDDMGQEMSTQKHHGGSGESEGMKMENDAFANSMWAVSTSTGKIIARITVGLGPTHPIPSPDGSKVFVTNTDGDSISVIDTSTWRVVKTIQNIPEPHDGAITPDNRLLYIAASGNSSVIVLDTSDGRIVKSIQVGLKPRGVEVGGINGEFAYVTNKGDGTLSIVDVPEGTVVNTVFVGRGAHAVRVGKDGMHIYVALSKENAVAVINAETGKVENRIPVGMTPEQIDLSPDGRWVYASNNADNTVSIIDVKRGKVYKTVRAGEGSYGVLAVSTDFIR